MEIVRKRLRELEDKIGKIDKLDKLEARVKALEERMRKKAWSSQTARPLKWKAGNLVMAASQID